MERNKQTRWKAERAGFEPAKDVSPPLTDYQSAPIGPPLASLRLYSSTRKRNHMAKEKKKKTKKKTTKKRSNKYQNKLSLYGIDEKEVLKELLKSPPMPKEEENNG